MENEKINTNKEVVSEEVNGTNSKKQKNGKVSAGKTAKDLLLWQSRAVSLSINVLILGYLMIYCTDTLGIPAAIVSTILLATKALDGLSDMVAGNIVDNTKSRWGKGRPYELFIVLLWFFTWLMFSCPPEMALGVKCAWIFIMYSLINAVCMTFLNANQIVYMLRAFKTENEYVRVSSLGSIITMLGAIAFNITFPVLMGTMATSPEGWSRLVGMWALPLAALGLIRMLTMKEKYNLEEEVEKKEKIKITESLAVVKENKYLLLIAAAGTIVAFIASMGVDIYYFKYVVGNIAAMGLVAFSTILSLPIMFFIPFLIRKFTLSKVVQIGYFVTALGFGLTFFAGANIPLIMVCSIIKGMGSAVTSMLLGLLVIDCAEYNEWKGGNRLEASMSSVMGFLNKIGAALGAAALGYILTWSGYVGGQDVVPDSALTTIRLLFTFIPMIFYIGAGTLFFFYTLNKQLPEIKAENEARREAKDSK